MRGIYAIRNLDTGEEYIGQAQNIEMRWSSHRRELNKGTHANALLQAAWSTTDRFEFLVFEEIAHPGNLNAAERKYVDEHRPAYNLASVAKTGGVDPEEAHRAIGQLLFESDLMLLKDQPEGIVSMDVSAVGRCPCCNKRVFIMFDKRRVAHVQHLIFPGDNH